MLMEALSEDSEMAFENRFGEVTFVWFLVVGFVCIKVVTCSFNLWFLELSGVTDEPSLLTSSIAFGSLSRISSSFMDMFFGAYLSSSSLGSS